MSSKEKKSLSQEPGAESSGQYGEHKTQTSSVKNEKSAKSHDDDTLRDVPAEMPEYDADSRKEIIGERVAKIQEHEAERRKKKKRRQEKTEVEEKEREKEKQPPASEKEPAPDSDPKKDHPASNDHPAEKSRTDSHGAGGEERGGGEKSR